MFPDSYTFKESFVFQSGLIDPQPGYPSFKPGQTMYDNHIEALDMALDKSWEFYSGVACDLHRILTKGIPFFEDHNCSGRYRTVDCWIGHDLCPNPLIIPQLMDVWHTHINELMKESKLPPIEIAWICHHMFEIIHPFIDGNGRTGRLLFNKVLSQLGEQPRIIYFKDRFQYYDSINEFKDKYFCNNCFVF